MSRAHVRMIIIALVILTLAILLPQLLLAVFICWIFYRGCVKLNERPRRLPLTSYFVMLSGAAVSIYAFFIPDVQFPKELIVLFLGLSVVALGVLMLIFWAFTSTNDKKSSP